MCPPDGDAERVFLLADQIGDGDPELVAAMHRVLAPYGTLSGPATASRPVSKLERDAAKAHQEWLERIKLRKGTPRPQHRTMA